MNTDNKAKRTLLTGFSNSSQPFRKRKIFCKHVPGCDRDLTDEVTDCPMMGWAEQNQSHFERFYPLHDPVVYCGRYDDRTHLRRCPLLTFQFNNDNALIKSITKPSFTPTNNISSLIKLLEWFISEPIVTPTDGDIRQEHNRFLFYTYHETACSRILNGSGILRILAVLHKGLSDKGLRKDCLYDYKQLALDLFNMAATFQQKALEYDSETQQRAQTQGWIDISLEMINARLFEVKQAAVVLCNKLADIDGFLQNEKAEKIDVGKSAQTAYEIDNNEDKKVDWKKTDRKKTVFGFIAKYQKDNRKAKKIEAIRQALEYFNVIGLPEKKERSVRTEYDEQK
jgi:hypothetical protein